MRSHRGIHYDYDIALVKLETRLDLNDHVAAIGLPKWYNEPSGNVTYSGWALKYYDDFKSEALQNVTVPIVDRNKCNKAVMNIALKSGIILRDGVKEHNICTGPLRGDTAACHVSINDCGIQS